MNCYKYEFQHRYRFGLRDRFQESLYEGMARFPGAPVEWVTGQNLDKCPTFVQFLSNLCPSFVYVQYLSNLG